MAGNAHRNRHGNQADCRFCQHRPKVARKMRLWRNAVGHRHNPTAKKRGKRHK